MSVLLTLAAQATSPVCTNAAECAGQGVDTFLGTPERIWASVVALAAGLIGGINGGVKLAVADGGLGTGNGVFGAALALVLGLAGTALGRLALARSRRAVPGG